jgi:WD40 repeat protein
MNSSPLLKELQVIEDDEVFMATFSPDGLKVAASNSQGVTIWDVRTANEQSILNDIWVTVVAYSPDGTTMACGTYGGSIILWDVRSFKELLRIEAHPFREDNTITAVTDLKFSSTGRVLASGGGDRQIKLWDPISGKLIKSLDGHLDFIQPLAFSSDGTLLASGSVINDNRPQENSLSDSHVAWHTDKLILWDVEKGVGKMKLDVHVGINALAFSPDGQILASGNDDASISLRDTYSGSVINTLHKHAGSVTSVAFSHNGEFFASGGGRKDGSITLWNAKTWQVMENALAHSSSVVSVEFSPDDRLLVSANSETIKLWQLEMSNDII